MNARQFKMFFSIRNISSKLIYSLKISFNRVIMLTVFLRMPAVAHFRHLFSLCLNLYYETTTPRKYVPIGKGKRPKVCKYKTYTETKKFDFQTEKLKKLLNGVQTFQFTAVFKNFFFLYLLRLGFNLKALITAILVFHILDVI